MKAGTLKPLYAAFGGYVSVYLDTSRDAENATHAIKLRWREAASDLTKAGAQPEWLDPIGALISDPAMAAPGRAVFAREGAITGTVGLRSAPTLPVARLAPLPQLRPALAAMPHAVPHLRVAADRHGGEIVTIHGPALWALSSATDPAAAGAAEQPPASSLDWQDKHSTGEITASEWPLHKTSVGGWSQKRYQRSAEHTWDENAKELAGHVSREAERAGAQFIVLAGDVRARGLVLERLPVAVRDRVVQVEAEVQPDSAEVAAAADATAERLATDSYLAGMDQWRALKARNLGVEGIDATVAALRDGQAATVFLGADQAVAADCWLGPDGTDLARTEADLAERGVVAPMTDRTDEAIIRAAACTDAELVILPDDDHSGPGPKQSVCATLRFPLAG